MDDKILTEQAKMRVENRKLKESIKRNNKKAIVCFHIVLIMTIGWLHFLLYLLTA